MQNTIVESLPSSSFSAAREELTHLFHRERQSLGRWLSLLALALPMVAIWALQSGAMGIDVVSVLSQWWQGGLSSTQTLHLNVITEIRLPRLLMTFVTGMGLAASGAVMQGICRNPLADPGLIGVSSGAALMAALAFVFAGQWQLPDTLARYLVPIAAFIGASGVSLLVFRLAKTTGGVNTLLLILAGVAINALAGTLLGLVNYIADDSTLRLITFWTMGSYAGTDWPQLAIVTLGTFAALLVFWTYRLPLTLMLNGENEARYLGIAVTRVKTWCLMAVAVATACAVCFTGIVGFVGLVTPHICRLLIGPDLRRLLPVVAMVGGILVSVADTMARTLLAPAEMPVGIVTAMLGVPFFLYLLMRQRGVASHA